MTTQQSAILDVLFRRIQERFKKQPTSSYITALMKKGKGHIARKVGEEAVELIVAALENHKKEIVEESADLLFHWLILMEATGSDPDQVYRTLAKRLAS